MDNEQPRGKPRGIDTKDNCKSERPKGRGIRPREIEKLKELAQAADIEGCRWRSELIESDPSRYAVVTTGRTVVRTYYTGADAEREAAYIAAACPVTVLELLAEIKRLYGELAKADNTILYLEHKILDLL